MADLINREELLAEYDRVHIGPPGGARKLIENAPTVATIQKWIPVTERLPEVWEDVLVHREGGIVDIEYQCSGGGWIYDGQTIFNATHWMPLPEPPKGE